MVPGKCEVRLLQQEPPKISDPFQVKLRMLEAGVCGTVNAGRDSFEASIRDIGAFMKRWPNAVRSLITGRFPMEAHRDLLLGRAEGIKNVIQLG